MNDLHLSALKIIYCVHLAGSNKPFCKRATKIWKQLKTGKHTETRAFRLIVEKDWLSLYTKSVDLWLPFLSTLTLVQYIYPRVNCRNFPRPRTPDGGAQKYPIYLRSIGCTKRWRDFQEWKMYFWIARRLAISRNSATNKTAAVRSTTWEFADMHARFFPVMFLLESSSDLPLETCKQNSPSTWSFSA